MGGFLMDRLGCMPSERDPFDAAGLQVEVSA
jgi:hypothetical protein